MKKHYNITVIGKVQGVFYRVNTKDAADKHRITGFVRNQPDGSVYIEAEGEEHDLQNFIKWCKKGPEKAKVEEVKVEFSTLKNFNDFVVKR